MHGKTEQKQRYGVSYGIIQCLPPWGSDGAQGMRVTAASSSTGSWAVAVVPAVHAAIGAAKPRARCRPRCCRRGRTHSRATLSGCGAALVAAMFSSFSASGGRS